MTERRDDGLLERGGIGCGTLLISAIVLRSCVVDGIERKLDDINTTLKIREIKTGNVIGGPESEKYVEINGKMFFYEIDAKPINESYGK